MVFSRIVFYGWHHTDPAPPGHQSLGRFIACFRRKYQASADSLARPGFRASPAQRKHVDAGVSIATSARWPMSMPCQFAPAGIGPKAIALAPRGTSSW